MADITKIQFKRSKVAGQRPPASSLDEGELALNLKDRTIFTKDDAGAIIDLGFAKGGLVEGNITQIGNIDQTGNTTVSGVLKSGSLTTGDITATTLTATGEIKGLKGSFTNIAIGDNFDKQILVSAGNNSKSIRFSTLGQTSGATKTSTLLMAIGAAPIVSYSANDDTSGVITKFSGTVEIPILNVLNTISHDSKSYINDSIVNYDSSSLVSWIYPGTGDANGVNYLRKFRSKSGGTIYHEVVDGRAGVDEIGIWKGITIEEKISALKSDGSLQLKNNLFVGGNDYSALGTASIAIGDNDTGFKSQGADAFDIMANNRSIIKIASTASAPIQMRKITNFTYADDSGSRVIAPSNRAIIELDTSLDGNNTGGNGMTFLGYNSGGKYRHYFRGTGNAVFDMGDGVSIQGAIGLNVVGPIIANNKLQVKNNTIEMVADGYKYLYFKTAAGAERALIYCNDIAGTGLQIRVNNQSTFYFTEGGTFSLPGAIDTYGGIKTSNTPQNVYKWDDNNNSTTDAKSYLRRFRSSSPASIWHETVEGSVYRLSTGIKDDLDHMVLSDSNVRFNGEIISQKQNGLRVISGANANGEPSATSTGFFIRNDGDKVYFMLTAAGDAYGSYNTLRPLTIHIQSGIVQMDNGLLVNGGIASIGGLTAQTSLSVGGPAIINGPASFLNGSFKIDSDSTRKYLYFFKSGAIPRDMGLIYSGNASSGNRLEIRDDAGYMAYFERGPNSGAVPVLQIAGTVSSAGRINAPEFYVTSDERFKENIKDIESQSSNLHKINIKRYKMKDGSNDNALGVIAQDVEKVFPELVSSNNEGFKSVNYRALSSVLWKIAQEQNIELESVKSRLDAIEALLINN